MLPAVLLMGRPATVGAVAFGTPTYTPGPAAT